MNKNRPKLTFFQKIYHLVFHNWSPWIENCRTIRVGTLRYTTSLRKCDNCWMIQSGKRRIPFEHREWIKWNRLYIIKRKEYENRKRIDSSKTIPEKVD